MSHRWRSVAEIPTGCVDYCARFLLLFKYVPYSGFFFFEESTIRHSIILLRKTTAGASSIAGRSAHPPPRSGDNLESLAPRHLPNLFVVALDLLHLFSSESQRLVQGTSLFSRITLEVWTGASLSSRRRNHVLTGDSLLAGEELPDASVTWSQLLVRKPERLRVYRTPVYIFVWQ